MTPNTKDWQPTDSQYFWFNALVGLAFIGSGTLSLLVGAVCVLSIIAAMHGLGLMAIGLLLWLCGGRLIFGALIGREKSHIAKK